MKKRLFLPVVWMTAIVLTACSPDSVLIVGGETYTAPLGQQEISEEVGAAETDGVPESADGAVVMVHICGWVAAPGVYGVPEGSRVYEVIELAGGFLPEAAENYLNLAQVVSDGQKLVVPSVDEVESDRYGQIADDAENGLVNINTADKERLMTLPGIGQSRAEAIIAWREQNGSFQTPEEIMQVSGIKEAAYEKIKRLITVE